MSVTDWTLKEEDNIWNLYSALPRREQAQSAKKYRQMLVSSCNCCKAVTACNVRGKCFINAIYYRHVIHHPNYVKLDKSNFATESHPCVSQVYQFFLLYTIVVYTRIVLYACLHLRMSVICVFKPFCHSARNWSVQPYDQLLLHHRCVDREEFSNLQNGCD